MQLLIISGFLGAGKTSFIQAMAKGTGRQFVIVENEFADANVDSKVLRAKQNDVSAGNKMEAEQNSALHSAEDAPTIPAEDSMNIWELSEGCICCSLNLDFSYSVLTIANTLDPDYLVVEPSGVAHLSAILEQLHKISYERIGILAPITIVDQQQYPMERAAYANYFFDQVGNAGTVVLSKSESLNPKDFKAIKKDLRIADDVDFPLTHYSKWQKEDWFKLLSRQWVPLPEEDNAMANGRQTRISDQRASKNISAKTFIGKNHSLRVASPAKILRRKIVQQQTRRADTDLMNVTFYSCRFSSVDSVYYFLEMLLSGEYGEIIRFKGFFPVKNEVIHVEGVATRFEITGFGNYTTFLAGQNVDEEREAFPFVVIGKNLKAKALLAALSADE